MAAICLRASSTESQHATFCSPDALGRSIRGEGITVTTPSGKQSGKFKVKTEDRSSITIWTDGDGPNDPQTFVFVDDRTIRWNVLEGKTITFRRDNEK